MVFVALHDVSGLLKSATDELHGCQSTQEKDSWDAQSVERKPADREDRVNAGFRGGWRLGHGWELLVQADIEV